MKRKCFKSGKWEMYAHDHQQGPRCCRAASPILLNSPAHLTAAFALRWACRSYSTTSITLPKLTCYRNTMHAFCLFSLTVVACCVVVSLACRTKPTLSWVEVSTTYSHIRRVLRNNGLSNHLLAQGGTLGVLSKATNWANVMGSQVWDIAFPRDEQLLDAGAGHLYIDRDRLWLRLKALFVKTSVKVLRQKINTALTFPRIKNFAKHPVPAMSMDLTTTFFAASPTQPHHPVSLADCL